MPGAITSLSPSDAVVAGSLLRHDGVREGLLLVTRSQGKAWKRVASEVHDLRGVTFQTIHFNDRLRGWVGGIHEDANGATEAFVFRTEDGGNHWRRDTLVMDPTVRKTLVHSLVLADENNGLVRVRFDTAEGERENTFLTNDGGRTWQVAEDGFRIAPAPPIRDPRVSFSSLAKREGWRLVSTELPGVTVVEQTANGGQTWMPVQELSVGAMASYYGNATSPHP
jgi:photosystem II stability/assembly factor-like uncharacterized protein